MEYTALIFDDCQDETDSYENLVDTINVYKNDPTNDDIQKILSSLSQYPAIYMNKDLQAFDTRLLMFSLQVAIEQNLAIDTYAQAVEALGETPLQHIKG